MTLPDTDTLGAIRESPALFVEALLADDPFDYQRDMLDSDHDRQAFCCGRQVGKSRVCSWRGLHKAITQPGSTVLITSNTQRQSSELFHQVKEEIELSKLPTSAWQIKRQTKTIIEFENGSRIICLPTGTDGANIRTYTADLVIVDEAAFINRTVFEDALEPMLATTSGTMILASTPWGTSGFFYDVFKKFPKGDWDRFKVSMSDSPLIDEEYIERQRRTKTQMSFKQEVLGEFVPAADAFFDEEVIRESVTDAITQQTETCYLGVDLARHGLDSSVFVCMDAEGNVFDAYSHSDKPLTAGTGRVRTLHDQYDFDAIYVDETGLGGGVVDDLQQDLAVVSGVKFTINKKQSLYNSLKEKMEDGVISIPDDRDLVTQLQEMRYELKNSGKMSIHHPDGGHDDWPDGLALAAWGLTDFTEPTRSSPVSAVSKRTRLS